MTNEANFVYIMLAQGVRVIFRPQLQVMFCAPWVDTRAEGMEWVMRR